jgi:hypothetical protein
VATAARAYLSSHVKQSSSLIVGDVKSDVIEQWDPPDTIVEGEEYQKMVVVSNTGSSECFVRMLVEFEDPAMAEAIDINFNEEHWTEKQSDGYYYYKEKLASGEATIPLFTTLHANADLSELRLIVYHESVQCGTFDTAIDAFEYYS